MAFTTTSLIAGELPSASWEQGRPRSPDRTASSRTLPEICEHLQGVVETLFLQERPDQIQPGTPIPEAYSRLRQLRGSGATHDAEFISIAAQTIRQLLRIHASTTGFAKAASEEALSLPISEVVNAFRREYFGVLDMDEALVELEKLDPHQANVVELHIFGGLAFEEISHALNSPAGAVRREWRTAKLWLEHHFSQMNKN